MLTKADEGVVNQMLTIADEGGRGGVKTTEIGCRNMWTAPYNTCAISTLLFPLSLVNGSSKI